MSISRERFELVADDEKFEPTISSNSWRFFRDGRHREYGKFHVQFTLLDDRWDFRFELVWTRRASFQEARDTVGSPSDFIISFLHTVDQMGICPLVMF